MEMKIKKKNSSYTGKDNQLAVMLLSPVFLYLLIVMLFPLLWTVYISFTNKKIGTPSEFIGLANYWELLTDSMFLKAVLHTLLFTLCSVVAKVVLGTVMALVINEPIRGRNIFRSLLIIPWTLPTVISILIWKWLYSDVGGVLNHILMSMRIVSEPVLWLSDPSMAMFSVILVNVWRGLPFIGISVLAGLQTISHDLYEAASLDGANKWQRFKHVTLPGINSVLYLSALVTTIWTLNDFEIVWLLTGGGPSNATNMISTYSYIVGFINMDVAKAVAVPILFLPFMIYLVNKVTNKTLVD
ncbi:carbohydrate ABC transporter permease [Cohnella faecalis]|uniref:Sugar ABC transporter permease n=1 Tax=Cohnella faecalis TaxID=2315694 RepID=A0A398CGW1_9BACL|nr:sugar ABC transporter permease [Cohnella faecalis]RIE01695.1 sugar ABC transporter permease [Cohnella faecalis]